MGTGLHRPFWKGFISGMAKENCKGRTAVVFLAQGALWVQAWRLQRVMQIVVAGKQV